jgi:hypothetical protein
MTHSNIHSLSSDDIFLDSWNKGYAIQATMWNNSMTWFFWITIGRVRLDGEMAASIPIA